MSPVRTTTVSRSWRSISLQSHESLTPLALLRRLEGRPRWSLWLPQGEVWVGWGRRAAVQARGPQRFAHLRAAWQAWREEYPDLPPELPLFLAAGFREQVPQRPWPTAFPNAQLVLPQAAVLWRMGEAEGTGFLLADEEHSSLLRPGPVPASASLPPLVSWEEGVSREAWEAMVDRALQAIAAGAFHKVVLARYRRLRFAGPVDPVTVLAALQRRYPETAVFLYEPQPGCAFVGATPELLLAKQGDRVRTVALAGSIRRGATPQEDESLARFLLASPKDRREHAWVVQALVEGLRPWAAELNVPDGPRLRTLPNIHHLETPIEARLTRGDVFTLVDALHPTPALGGWPKAPALAFLQAEEPFDRGWYAGPLGYVTPHGNARVYVAIRAALICKNHAWLFAGAGIVSGSHPTREWAEIDLKFQPMMDVLGVDRAVHRA